MIDVLKTLQFMKPGIKVVVWDNDIDKIEYNPAETFRPTKEEILAVDQKEVNKPTWSESRIMAYEAKGWFSDFDVIDDAVKRGWDAVLDDRNTIKQQFPKTE